MWQGSFYLVAGLSAPPLVKEEYEEEKVELRKKARIHNTRVMEYIERNAFEGDVKLSVISLDEFKDNPSRLGLARKKRRVLPKVDVPDKVKEEDSGYWITTLYNEFYFVPEKVEAKTAEDAINNAFSNLIDGWDYLDDIPFPVKEEEDVYIDRRIHKRKAPALSSWDRKADALLAKIDNILYPVPVPMIKKEEEDSTPPSASSSSLASSSSSAPTEESGVLPRMRAQKRTPLEMKRERENIRLRKEWRETRNGEREKNARPLRGEGKRKDNSEYMWPCVICGAEISNKSKNRHWNEAKYCLKLRRKIP